MTGPGGEGRILLAEDDPATAELITLLLTSRGYDVLAEPDGELALAAAKRSRPDLILLDVMMPKLNGFEVLHLLKEDPDLNDVPVVFLSAKDRLEDRVAGLSMGGQDYILKPFDRYELCARVDAALRITNPAFFEKRTDRRAVEFSLADPLTGLANAPYFLERLSEELARSQRHHYPSVLVLMRVDPGGEVRKKMGDWTADQVQQRLALLIKNSNRVNDPTARLEDWTFAWLLTQTDEGGALAHIRRFQDKISRSTLLAPGHTPSLTVSLGVAVYPPEKAMTSDELMNRAMRALEHAAARGGNGFQVAEAD